jgi:hypothetical protein
MAPSELSKREILCATRLCVEYPAQGTHNYSFADERAPLDHHGIVFLENQVFKSLIINAYKERIDVPSTLDVWELHEVGADSALVRAIGTCFPTGNTMFVSKASRTPTVVGGLVQIDGIFWLVQFKIFRGAVRSPIFQEELLRSVKFVWPEPDAK